ncbi:MAG: response regulator [Myxococcaceae bacterium]
MSFVLLADDNADFAETMAELLRLHGMIVRTVTSAQDAISVLKRSPSLPGLVITDLMMPGNGHELIAAMTAERWSKIPLFVVTGSAEPVSPRVDLVFRRPFDTRRFARVAASTARRAIASRDNR